MQTFEVHAKPQGKMLKQYYEDRSSVSLIIGPLGSGKTFQTCQKILKIASEQEPDANGVRSTRWFAIRNTYSDLMTTTIKDWLDLFGDLGKYKAGGASPPSHTIDVVLEDGTRLNLEMIFLALDRPDSVKKLRGSQITGIWYNEIKELDKAVVDMGELRVGRYPKYATWKGIVADTNAPDEDHWLYKLVEIDKPKQWKIFKQPGGVMRQGTLPNGNINWVVNPYAENMKILNKKFKDENYYTRSIQGKSDDWIAVNLANEYGSVSTGKAVYPEYNDNLHCVDFEINKEVPIYRGWDFGVAACVFAQFTPMGRLVVFKEFVADITTGIDSFSDLVLNYSSRYKGYEFIDIGDPAGMAKSQQINELTCFGILQNKGIDIQAGNQDLKSRLEGVRYFLSRLIDGSPAFYLHSNCKKLRAGFRGGYCYKRLQTSHEAYVDKPVKDKYSHPQDCLQYIAAYIREHAGWDDYEEEPFNESYGRSSIGGY